MKKTLVLFAVFVLMAGTALAMEEGRFFRYPSIHQDKIVFTYEGDLWLVSAQGLLRARSKSIARASPHVL